MSALPTQEQMAGKLVPGHYIQGSYQRLFNQSMSKSWVELFQLEAFFSKYNFSTMVELGTGTGTTTLFLALMAYFKKAKVYTFDTKPIPSTIIDLLETLGVLWYCGDVFDETMANRIIERIKRPGRSVLYCDNGKKVVEAETFAKHLKKDDILICHDFEDEIKKADLDRIGKEYNLDYLDYDWFQGFTAMHVALIKR